MMAFFIEDQQKTWRKVDQFGGMTFFFFEDQQKTRRRVDQPKNFGLLQKTNFAPFRAAF